MKAILNVDGKALEVTLISYVNGKVASVQVHHGDNVYKTYQSHNSFSFDPTDPMIDFNKHLKFPEIEQRIMEANNKLIEHLEEFQAEENEYLTHIAIDAMEEEVPFINLGLGEKQKEYKLQQQRILGVLDAIEEVKAFVEGWYEDNSGKVVNE